MTPHADTPENLAREASKELDKAKDALTNCVLLAIADQTVEQGTLAGDPGVVWARITQDPLLADEVERMWAQSLKQLIPHAARVVRGKRGL